MRALLVCSSGGHLFQLYQLRPWWQQHERTWVTFDKPDARSLLAGEDTVWAHHPTTRNVPNLLRNFRLALGVIRSRRPDIVVSDGAAVGLPFLAAAKLFGAKTVFIEVFDRQDSLTGKLVRPFADRFLVQREAQLVSYPAATTLGPILYNPDVVIPGVELAEVGAPDTIFATVGTDHHPFERLMDWCGRARIGENAIRTFAQYGTARLPRGWEGADFLTYPQMVEQIRRARVVVTHGGPATVALCLALGKRPIVVPRLRSQGEVVDDHQVAFAERLELSRHARVATTLEALNHAIEEALAAPSDEESDLSLFRSDESVRRFEALVKELVARAEDQP